LSSLRIGSTLLASAVFVGCLGGQTAPTKQRYVLDVTPVQVSDPGSRGVVQVNRVGVAPLFERKGLVYRTGDDRYESAFYHEFYSPPGELIREVAGQWLHRSGVFTEVVSPIMRADPDWWLEGRVAKLYGDVRRPDAPEAVLEIGWTLLDARSSDFRPVLDKTYSSVVALSDREPATIVEGLRRALVHTLERLNEDLATALDARRAPVEEEDVRP
jgi:uncharacterized lipoprotein YmbA